MLRHINDQPPLREGDGPIALIIAPTRELAFQIYLETKPFAKAYNQEVGCIYGGANISGQLSILKRGVHIVVCTPGRMIDVLTTNNGKITNLHRVTYVVLDEADRMFDMGFEPQITRILMNIRPDRQSVLFSATFPKSIENLAKKVLYQPLEIVVGNRGQACKNVEQRIEIREEMSKLWRLLEILGEWNDKGSILIFVDKQTEADELFKELVKYGYFPLVLHGGQDPEDRDFTIADFRRGTKNIMVATSVCARGLDIKSIVLVVNFKCPNHCEDYIHRVGRTGRAGAKGTAITFITPEEDHYASELIKALQMASQPIPESLKALHNEFKKKVSNGEARENKGNHGYTSGHGFKFNEEEITKFRAIQNVMLKEFGLDFDNADDENEDEEGSESGGPVSRVGDAKKALDKPGDQKKAEKEALKMIRDPSQRHNIISKAALAAKEAIQRGASQEEIIMAAHNSIKEQLMQFKPVQSLKVGVENAMKAIDNIENKVEENSDKFNASLEVNDLPQRVRMRVIKKDFLEEISELTSTTISVKGQVVDPHKKVPIGQKKQYIYILGDSKYDVTSAYNEIKRVIDEANAISIAATYGANGRGFQ